MQIKLNNSEIFIHECNSKNIIINIPGYGGTAEGYENKYIKLGDYIVSKELGSFVRMNNSVPRSMYNTLNRNLYPSHIISKTHEVIEYCINNSIEICGEKDPNIYLIGTSAGGAVAAYMANRYKEIKKILLCAPSGNIEMKQIMETYKDFKGELSIIIGENDEVVGTYISHVYLQQCKNASEKRIRLLHNCNHNFTGEENGKLLSHAPFWAFDNENHPILDSNKGIILYE